MQPEEMIQLICENLGVTQAAILSKRGPLPVVFSRFIAIYLVYTRTKTRRLSALGKLFNKRKGTIRYALRQTSDLLETQNPQFAIMFKTAQDAIDRRLYDLKG